MKVGRNLHREVVRFGVLAALAALGVLKELGAGLELVGRARIQKSSGPCLDPECRWLRMFAAAIAAS